MSVKINIHICVMQEFYTSVPHSIWMHMAWNYSTRIVDLSHCMLRNSMDSVEEAVSADFRVVFRQVSE